MNLKTHFVFPGNCEKAFTLYEEALNGKITFLFRKKEDKSVEVKEEDKEKVPHMVLKADHFELAGEDANSEDTVIAGNNNKMVLVFHNLEKLHRTFDLLSKGGKVIFPPEKTFFCDALGELIDPFGIQWIIMMSDEGYEAQ